jgi:hypothetical protein
MKRERLTTLACALGALLVFAMLFVHTGPPGGRDVSAPTTVERRANGLLGAMSWLREEGIATVSLRERFDTLAKSQGLAPTGNLLIVTLPAATAFRTDEAVALDGWIRHGNTLLIMAALSDRPEWARFDRELVGDLQLLSGLEAQALEAPPKTRATRARGADGSEGLLERTARGALAPVKPIRNSLLPNRAHPYLEGVRRVDAFSDLEPVHWSMKVPRDGFMLALGHEETTGEGALWIRPLGAGTILVSGFASLFSNRALAQQDNARLLANIVAMATTPGGSVIFDDQHQGVSATYDPAKFYKDRRLYATLAIVAAAWLLWVLGGTRLQAPAVPVQSPQETQLVRDTGLFLARVLRPAAAARRLFDNFLLGIRTLHLDGQAADEAALWAWLEQHPRLASADVAQLKSWYAQAHAHRKLPLVRLRNLIVRTERLLTA